MSAERQSPSAAYVPTQTTERIVIRSEERTSADLRNCSSGVSAGREPTAAACLAILLDHSRKLMRRTLGQRPGRLAVWVAPIGRASSGIPAGALMIGLLYEDDTALTFAELLTEVIGGYEPSPI